MESDLKLVVFLIIFSLFFYLYSSQRREFIRPKMVPDTPNQHFNNGKFLRSSSLKETNLQDNSCIGMFNIGFGLNRASVNDNFNGIYSDLISSKDWNQLLKEKEAASQSYENYFPFVNSISSRIKVLSNGSLTVKNGTRLQLTNGKLPYLPCTVKEYDGNNLLHCLSKYQEANRRLWVIFLGDSRARNMFLFFIKRSQEVIKWKIDKENEQDLLLESILNFRDHTSGINATSSNGDFVTFVPADYGLINLVDFKNPYRPRDFLVHLLKLNRDRDTVPDLLVINFGIHEYVLKPHRSIYDRHDAALSNWNEMKKIMEPLAKKINVLALYQTFPRDSSLRLLNKKKKLLRSFSHYYFEHILMDFGARFVDNVMRGVNRLTNVIQWDSTLPFYLASASECNNLVKYNYSSIYDEIENNSTPFQEFMCHDEIHKSRSVVEDEATMILNLLCNKLLSLENFYCCS